MRTNSWFAIGTARLTPPEFHEKPEPGSRRS
jgi:hypothetical protein